MYVKDWMSEPAITLEPGVCLEEARALMERRGVRRLPVTEGGRLVGIVTRSDIESEVGRRPNGSEGETRRGLSRTVGEVMTHEPAVVTPDETLERAAVLMLNRRVSGLPVVDGEHVVGVITETDVFRAMVDILGFNERGARVVIALNSQEALSSWFRKLADSVCVRTLVTYHDPATRQWKAVVRLRGRLPAATRVS